MATMAFQDQYQSGERQYQWHGHPGKGRLRDMSATSSERQYAMFNHLAGLLSLADFFVVGFITCLVMWLVRRDDSAFLDDHGKEALNFQISLTLYWIGLAIVSIPFLIVTLGLGIIILGPVGSG